MDRDGVSVTRISMPNMTGRPGHRTMEMNGGSSVPYLTCTLCVLFFVHFSRGGKLETEGFLTTRGGRGSFPLCCGTFARSYSVSSIGINGGLLPNPHGNTLEVSKSGSVIMDTMVAADALGKRSLPGGDDDGDESSNKTRESDAPRVRR